MPTESTLTLIKPVRSDEASGILPSDEWGKWVPRIEGNRRLRLPTEPSQRTVVCYTCGKDTPVPEKALSALCAHCRSHLQLVDVSLNKDTQRTRVRTLGCLTVASDVCLSHVDFECGKLVLKGQVDGKITCHGEMHIASPSLHLTQPLRAKKLIVESGSVVRVSEGLHADKLILHGELHGFVRASDSISIESGGVLQGDCRTPDLRFASRGGKHHGRWDTNV